MRVLWASGFTVAIGALVLVGAKAEGYRYNHTESMPIGLWHEVRQSKPYRVGDLVVVCPSLRSSQKIYPGPGDCPTGTAPMLKPIGAIAGDVVQMSAFGISVNGQTVPHSAPLLQDEAGRRLDAYRTGTYTVAPGEVWLVVPKYDSFDSRYIGPVSVSDVLGVASPVLVWR